MYHYGRPVPYPHPDLKPYQKPPKHAPMKTHKETEKDWHMEPEKKTHKETEKDWHMEPEKKTHKEAEKNWQMEPEKKTHKETEKNWQMEQNTWADSKKDAHSDPLQHLAGRLRDFHGRSQPKERPMRPVTRKRRRPSVRPRCDSPTKSCYARSRWGNGPY